MRIQQSEPQQSRPLPGVRYTAQTDPNAFGAGIAKAVGGLGDAMGQTSNQLSQRAQEMQQEINANTVLDTSAKWSTEVNSYLHDANNGIFTLKGSQTAGLTEAAAKKLQEINAKYENTLQNDNQKDAFKKFTTNRVVATVEGVSKYQADQHQEWKKQSKEGIKVNVLANVEQISSVGITDPKMIYGEIEAGIRAIDAQGIGQAKEYVLAEKRQFISDANTKVINSYLGKQDYAGARLWYEKHKDLILGGAAIESTLTKGEEVAEFQGLAKKLLGTYGHEKEKEALDEVDAMLPPGIKREKAKDYVKGEIAVARRLDNQGEADRFNQAMLAMRNAKSFDEMQVIANNSGLRKADHLASLESYAKSKLGIDPETGRPKHTPLDVYIQALTEVEGGQLPDVNHFLMKYGSRMSDADLRKFSEKIQNGDSSMGWIALIKDFAPELKDEDIPIAIDAVEEMEKQFKFDNKRAPNNYEKTTMIKDATAKVILKDGNLESFYKTNRPKGMKWNNNLQMFTIRGFWENGLFQTDPSGEEYPAYLNKRK